jgi:two-component sensor histidine kinase
LEKLVEDELAPYRDDTNEPDKFLVRGQNVMLEPATAQTVALALHELITNAAKYGALSAPQGRVRLTWDVLPDTIAMQWEETGGPPVEVPETKGFGTRVIGAIIEGQLGGASRFDWEAGGLQCMISIPRSDLGKLNHPRRSEAA